MESILFDRGWRYLSGKFMTFFGQDLHNVDESRWKAIDLPHDAVIGLERNPSNPSGMAGGYTPNSMLYYCKEFDCPEEWRNKEVIAEFEGVYMNAEILLNGNLIVSHPYGYTSFFAELTPYLKYGRKNVLLVTVNNLAQANSRWYAGSGIYRHVRLHVGELVHIRPWQFKVCTPEVSAESAEICFSANLTNLTGSAQQVSIRYDISEKGTGVKVLSGQITPLYLMEKGDTSVEYSVQLKNPKLWDIDSPNLYEAAYEVLSDKGEVLDSGSVTFGIRSISFDSKNGFQLNGRTVKMKGGCIHHDHGPLGAAAFDDAEERRVRILKDAGFNAIRCAHNPPSVAFLDVCDRLGMLVVDEAFDCWRLGKNPFDYHLCFSDWWKRDLDSMIDRDYNHPSIVVWSVGNEVIERDGRSGGVEICRMLADHAHSKDPSRPVTIACNDIVALSADDDVEDANWAANLKGNVIDKENDLFGDKTRDVFASLDIAGYNYLIKRYGYDQGKFPDRVIMGTETFPHTHYDNWKETMAHDNVVGDFVWTSFDYLGEAGIGKVEYDEQDGWGGAYPWFYANCGDFDICGTKRPQSYYRDIVWDQREKPFIGVYDPRFHGRKIVLKEWAWEPVQEGYSFPGCEGMETLVDVYSQYDEVELFVNGKSYGRKPAGDGSKCIAQFTITYEPGELTAIAYQDGMEKSRETVRTTGAPAKILLEPEDCSFCKELIYVRVEAVDQNGERVPYAENEIQFSCTGSAEIIAVGNGNPITEESFTADHRKAYEGRALVILRRKGEGSVALTASSDGLEGTSVTL